MPSSAKNKEKKSFFGNLFKKKKVTNRPAYVPSVHPNMSHNNMKRMKNMSIAHAAAMNNYTQASQGFVPLQEQSHHPNTLYGQLPSPFNTYASVNTTKQDRKRNKLISRIRTSFNDNESIKTQIMSRLISNEDKKKNGTRFKRENPYGEHGEDPPSRRNEPHINGPIVYASLNKLALGQSTGTAQPLKETNYGTVAGTQTNTGKIVPLQGSRPTIEQRELLLEQLMRRGNAHAGGARKRTRKHKNKKSKSKSRKYRK